MNQMLIARPYPSVITLIINGLNSLNNDNNNNKKTDFRYHIGCSHIIKVKLPGKYFEIVRL